MFTLPTFRTRVCSAVGALMVLVTLNCPQIARALHFDYLVEQNPDGRLVVGSNNFDANNTLSIPVRVFNRDLDENFFGSDPGFSAVSPGNVPTGYSALPPNTPLSLDLLAFSLHGQGVSNLWYWNGAGPVDFQPVSDGTAFTLSLGSFSSATVTGAAAGVPGFVVQTTSATGAMHRHPNYQLQGTQSQGLYLIAEHARMPGLTSSIPFYTVFVTDAIGDASYNAAVQWANQKLVIPGDVNTDGVVDISDVQTIAAHWLQKAPPGDTNYVPAGDANYDGVVDISDIQTIAAHWLQSSGGGTAVTIVPEPGDLPLCALAAAIVGLAVRHRALAAVDRPKRTSRVFV